MEEYILIIDQDTVSTQAVLVDKLGNRKAVFQKEIPQYFPQPGFVELDANEIWISVMYVVMELMKKNQIEPESIKEIGIISQNQTTVVWNKNTGVPIYYAISEQSKQSKAICEAMKAAKYEQLIKEKTGLPLEANYSATKIKWILDNVAGTREKAEAGELIFGTLDSWLVYRMTEEYTHIMNECNASRTLIYNVHELKWDKELLKLFHIPEAMLPEVKNSSEIYGYTAPYHFFGMETPITGVSRELQAVLRK
ncbi:MAG: hypothetical protein IJA36_08730 [Lachnospiraceae bacterium]|nr:hypothetical protein [Lachnospiraceae bacterium]